METKIKTGNPIVDEIGMMNFTGNIIPEAWYKTVVNESGKAHLLAINILSDIVYWYRPAEKREEQSSEVYFTKKFRDKDFLQKSYEQLCDKFNASTKQVREALKLLEAVGVVKRRFRTIETNL